MTKREAGLDATKAVAMFLVVFIHIWAYAPNRDAYRTYVWLDNFCMLGCLPPFFMLGGMFSRRLFNELSVKRLVGRLVGCLWPVGTMIGMVGLGIRCWVLGGTLDGGIVNYLLSGGWFFFCLALCEMVTFAAHWVARERVGLRIALLALGYVALWALPRGMFHAVEMLPFFWFGVYALPRLRESRHATLVGLLAGAAFVIACCSVGDCIAAGLLFHTTSMGLLDFTGRGLGLMAARIALGLCGGVGLLTAVCAAVRHFRALEGLAPFGTQTMGVFFLHTHLLGVYYALVGWTGGGLAGRFVLACVVFAMAHALAILTHWNAVVGAVLWNPLELLRRKDGRRAS